MFEWCPRPEKDNGIGLHDDGNSGDGPGTMGFMSNLIDAMADLGFPWLKLLTNVDHKYGRLDLIERARKKGLMVIVRPFRQPCHPHGLNLYDDYLRALRDKGCEYVEVGNEPNLASVECWQLYPDYKYEGATGHAAFVNLLYDQWLRNADKIRRAGLIPLFPAMSPTAYTSQNVFYHHALYEQILGLGKLRGNLEWAFEGAGVAIHNRPSDNPLDAVDHCAFRDYEWIEASFEKALKRKIPLFGTEAGYEDGMIGGYILHVLGNLYPNNNDYIHWHKVLNHEMMARFNPQHPKAWADYLMCQCAWLAADDGWYASGWARNARVGGGPLPTFTDMGQISRFTRAEGEPYVPPPEPPTPPTPPEPQPGTDEIEFIGLSDAMKEMLSVSGPENPEEPYWKVTVVEVQPQTDNMSAWVLCGGQQAEAPIFFWPGTEVPMEWKGPDPYSPPGAKDGGYSQVMHHCWGSFGVRMPGNSQALFGIGLYGLNLEITHTAHRPVLVYFQLVQPGPPSPPEPPVPPQPDTEYTLLKGMASRGLTVVDDRERLMKYAKMDRIGKRSPDNKTRKFLYKLATIHHTAGDGPLDMEGLAEWHTKVPPKGRGFAHISYHFVIDKDGTVHFAKPLRLWSEQNGRSFVNQVAIGIAVHGVLTEKAATDAQLRSLKLLIESLEEWIMDEWGKRYPLPVVPHFWLVDTACPGGLYEQYRAHLDN